MIFRKNLVVAEAMVAAAAMLASIAVGRETPELRRLGIYT